MRRNRMIGLMIVVCLACTTQAQTIGPQYGRAKRDTVTSTWYKNGVIYNIDVKIFKDANGDGVGDFGGLTQKIGYLDSLGIDVIWLAPFQPTSDRTDGYDVTDYYSLDSLLGNEATFNLFIKEAKRRGIKVVMDLVMNHTSDQHPWFVEARSNPKSPYRSWYIWSKTKPEQHNSYSSILPSHSMQASAQNDNWSYDSLSNEYYYHSFHSFQPDLNTQNPAVQQEVRKIIEHWMGKGVAGFKLDRISYFVEIQNTKGHSPSYEYEMIPRMRRHLKVHQSDGLIMGEVSGLPKENRQFFGKKGDGAQMMFNSYVNQHLFYALASKKVKSLENALEATRNIPEGAQWALCLRNHDALNLDILPKNQQNKVIDEFGPEKEMLIDHHNIRRRLAPMLDNNMKRIKFSYSLLFSLPSTPVIRYGEEIGMGDDLTLQDKEAIRTPMQWNGDINAGFSCKQGIYRSVIDTGDYTYKKINVAAQSPDPNSLLNWMTHMIDLRKQCPEISNGTWEIIKTNSPQLLVIRYRYQGKSLLVIHNFSDEVQKAVITKKEAGSSRMKDVLTLNESFANKEGKHDIYMGAYSYRWYRY